jgi:hypothetical protein
MNKRHSSFSTGNLDSLLQELQGVVHPDILAAPRLNWREVFPKFTARLLRTAIGEPWVNHLAFMVVVLTSYTRLDRTTIERCLYNLHARWRVLFPAYHLISFNDWDPVEHLPRYLNDTMLPDSFETRQEFLWSYTAAALHTHAYLRSLPSSEREQYQQWTLPLLPPDLHRQLSRKGELFEAQAQRRKLAVDAIAPHFAQLRGEAHLRWNQLKRLRIKFSEAVALVQAGQEALPLRFSYEEPGKGQRLHFILWDRPSFVLAHSQQYSKTSINEMKRKARGYCAERNHYFLEFVGVEPLLDTPAPPDPDGPLLWFADLLRYDLLCTGPVSGTEEEVGWKQVYLQSWGYEAMEGEERTPFRTSVIGLLAWPHASGISTFMTAAQEKTERLLFLVEPLFAAATFGLAALDFFTTTGARMSELLQVSLTPECLYTLVVEGTQRLLLRLVPKGTDKPADYIVGTETRRNFEKVAHLLQEHYHLQADQPIPYVSFHENNQRHHQFPDARPYLFQYSGEHLHRQAITACMRFLCHGMVFQTADGRTIPLQAHTLRHVFAAHIHHVEQVPLDIVAVLLHHKDVRVTRYYAAPPWQQVLASANSLLDHFATQLGSVEEAFVRAPAELQRQLEEAKQQVGTLAKVIGGDCTCHAICPISFACTGCVFKVPDPTRREEIVEQKQMAFVRLEQVKKRGLGPEIVKMEALIRRCETEESEMTMIEIYRKDEQYEPRLTVELGG